MGPTAPSPAWESSGPLITPTSDDSHTIAGIKDPTVVRHKGQWLVYASVANSAGEYSLAQLKFSNWSQASSAVPYFLDRAPAIGKGYKAAPQVFYFAPQKKWYLVYQTGNGSYSTADDPSKPETWSAPKNFYSDMPDIIRENIGNGYWVDFWVICDTTYCYLFSSDDNGHLYRSRTTLKQFPEGFDEPVIAMEDPDRFRLFEASNVYKVQGTDQYLLLVEAIGENGRRYFRSWTSTSITGPWTAWLDTQDRPFAGLSNVTFRGTSWTEDISHGEMIRATNDQTLTISSCPTQFLYQGLDPAAGGDYNTLPWKLGLLTRKNSAC